MVDAAVIVRPDDVFMAKENRLASRTVGVARNLSSMRPGRCRCNVGRSLRGCNRASRRMSAVRCDRVFAARTDTLASPTV